MSILKGIITGIDGESADIVKIIVLANIALLGPILIIGVGFYIYGYLISRPFDVQSLFTAVLTFEGGIATLLTSGAAAILMKKDTEPNGDKSGE